MPEITVAAYVGGVFTIKGSAGDDVSAMLGFVLASALRTGPMKRTCGSITTITNSVKIRETPFLLTFERFGVMGGNGMVLAKGSNQAVQHGFVSSIIKG